MGLFNGLFTRRGVRFVRVHSETDPVPQPGSSGIVTYEVYTARTARRGRDFLNSRTVTERDYHIVVETPEGTWSKDIDGLYKE
jgi:hypothetical protein